METFLYYFNSEYTSLFKSYYVVWKLDPPNVEKKEEYMFKSYYVVWKQKRNAYDRLEIWRFKSYYVVWKLPGFSAMIFCILGLNRTM